VFEFFCFFLCLLFIVWCYYSLFDIATFIVTICLMLLLFLLPLAWCSLLDTITPFSTPLLLLLHLVQCCCSFYYSLLNIVDILATLCLMVLPLAWHCYSSSYSLYCYLFNVTTPFAAPCLTLLFLYYPLFTTITPFVTLWSMLLLLLLLLGQRCFSTFLGRCCCFFTHSSSTQFAQIPLCYVVMLLFLYFLLNVSVPTLPILDLYFLR